MTDLDEAESETGTGIAAVAPRRTRIVLVAILAVALVVAAGTVGWLIRGGGSSSSAPNASSVDAGFARDMATHHIQAVTMAGYERDNTTSPALKILAFDIETSQNFQVGEMSGWLDDWHLSRNSTSPMSWMGHHLPLGPNGLMPGMATPTQLDELESAHGTKLDILFLQLMIHHHQGGIPMAQYAEQHAKEPYVRQLASTIISAQTSEILQMEQMLRKLGGTVLPQPQ